VGILRFRIINKLKKPDYEILCDFLNENRDAIIELLPRMDFESFMVEPLTLTAIEKGYLLCTELIFQQPIGLDIYESLRIGDELKRCIKVNYRNIKMSISSQKENQLEGNVNKIIRLLERLVNYTADFLNQLIEKSSTISSESLDQQFNKILREKELQKRGELPQPYAIIHAKGWRDAKERAGDLVPLYLERDKAYLYEDKNVYILLPRNFAKKLLMLDSSVMLPEDSFNEKEKAVLEKLCVKRYLKKRKIRGKIYYSDLNERTRQVLIKGLKNTSR